MKKLNKGKRKFSSYIHTLFHARYDKTFEDEDERGCHRYVTTSSSDESDLGFPIISGHCTRSTLLAHNENEIEAITLIEKYKNWNKHLFFIQSVLSFHFSCFLVRSFFLTDLQPASRKWPEWKWEGQREGGKNLNFELKTSGEKCLLRTGKQEQKGLKQGAYDYYCYSSAKKLSKTITSSDKKWSNAAWLSAWPDPPPYKGEKKVGLKWLKMA